MCFPLPSGVPSDRDTHQEPPTVRKEAIGIFGQRAFGKTVLANRIARGLKASAVYVVCPAYLGECYGTEGVTYIDQEKEEDVRALYRRHESPVVVVFDQAEYCPREAQRFIVNARFYNIHVIACYQILSFVDRYTMSQLTRMHLFRSKSPRVRSEIKEHYLNPGDTMDDFDAKTAGQYTTYEFLCD